MSYDNTSLFDAVSFSERNEFNYHVISLYFLWRITVKGAGVGKNLLRWEFNTNWNKLKWNKKDWHDINVLILFS